MECDGERLTSVIYSSDGSLLNAHGVIRRQGEETELHRALEQQPMSIFFDDGAFFRGEDGCILAEEIDRDFFPLLPAPPTIDATTGPPVDASGCFAVLQDDLVVLSEKGQNKTTIDTILNLAADPSLPPKSLLQVIALQARAQHADFVYCDDSTGEVADLIIGWSSHPETGRPHLRLVHCKSMSSSTRSRFKAALQAGETPSATLDGGLTGVQEVSQQVLRSVYFVLKEHQAIARYLDQRAQDRPTRFVVGTSGTLLDLLDRSPLERTSDVWICHPGVSARALARSQGVPMRTLLGSMRARCRSARCELGFIGRA